MTVCWLWVVARPLRYRCVHFRHDSLVHVTSNATTNTVHRVKYCTRAQYSVTRDEPRWVLHLSTMGTTANGKTTAKGKRKAHERVWDIPTLVRNVSKVRL